MYGISIVWVDWLDFICIYIYELVFWLGNFGGIGFFCRVLYCLSGVCLFYFVGDWFVVVDWVSVVNIKYRNKYVEIVLFM